MQGYDTMSPPPGPRIALRASVIRRIEQSRVKLEYRSGPPAQNHFVC
jgi:hypothetical protein